MEIRLIFFKEIVGWISLKNGPRFSFRKHVLSREEKIARKIFSP